MSRRRAEDLFVATAGDRYLLGGAGPGVVIERSDVVPAVALVEPASAGVAVDDGEECTAVFVGDLGFAVVEQGGGDARASVVGRDVELFDLVVCGYHEAADLMVDECDGGRAEDLRDAMSERLDAAMYEQCVGHVTEVRLPPSGEPHVDDGVDVGGGGRPELEWCGNRSALDQCDVDGPKSNRVARLGNPVRLQA